MNILEVVLSQFHHGPGKRIAASDPPQNLLTKEQFQLIRDIIVPRQYLCGRILATQFLEDYFLVIFPILSSNSQLDDTYKRQIYYYSISIIVERKDYLNKTKQPLYKQIVTKLASFFRVMEETHHIIHRCYENPNYTNYLYSILKYFRSEINLRGECNLNHLCTHYTFINANKSPFTIQDQNKHINIASVPVTLLSLDEISKVQSQFGQQLLRYAYQGNYTIKKINRLHDGKKDQIKLFYSKGMQKGLVYLLDMFSLNNCYTLTQRINQYLPQQPRHSDLAIILNSICLKQEKIQLQELLCIYLQFNRVTPLHKIIEANRKLIGKLDIQKLVRFGQIMGILERIHQKIVYNSFPQPLIMEEQLKRIILERQHVINQKVLQDQFNKLEETIKKDIMSGCTVDEIMLNSDTDYDKLMKLLNPQNRFVLKTNQ